MCFQTKKFWKVKSCIVQFFKWTPKYHFYFRKFCLCMFHFIMWCVICGIPWKVLSVFIDMRHHSSVLIYFFFIFEIKPNLMPKPILLIHLAAWKFTSPEYLWIEKNRLSTCTLYISALCICYLNTDNTCEILNAWFHVMEINEIDAHSLQSLCTVHIQFGLLFVCCFYSWFFDLFLEFFTLELSCR